MAMRSKVVLLLVAMVATLIIGGLVEPPARYPLIALGYFCVSLLVVQIIRPRQH